MPVAFLLSHCGDTKHPYIGRGCGIATGREPIGVDGKLQQRENESRKKPRDIRSTGKQGNQKKCMFKSNKEIYLQVNQKLR